MICLWVRPILTNTNFRSDGLFPSSSPLIHPPTSIICHFLPSSTNFSYDFRVFGIGCNTFLDFDPEFNEKYQPNQAFNCLLNASASNLLLIPTVVSCFSSLLSPNPSQLGSEEEILFSVVMTKNRV